jgi:L-threonylcarbamoyladenylate synthase
VNSLDELITLLKEDKVAILPTDTIYGLHARAKSASGVGKIYQLKSRTEQKPLIILISSLSDLSQFGVKLSSAEKQLLEKIWPNPVSVILKIADQKWEYLHKGTKTLAFRMPKNDLLLGTIKQVGPLVSTSANPEGQKSAETVEEAKQYFGERVDFYLDAGPLRSQASTVLRLNNGKLEILRPGLFDAADLNFD